MNKILEKLTKHLEAEFGGQVSEADDVSVAVAVADIFGVTEAIKNAGFEVLSSETAVDYWPELDEAGNRYHLVYQFTSLQHKLRMEVRALVEGNDPEVPSIESIYRNAGWNEREIWDMFGIKFAGHGDMRRILMPADWEGHPLRKDYPLGYEEVQFTFNYEEIEVRKPRPRD